MWRQKGAYWLSKPFVFLSLIMLLKIYLVKIVIYGTGSGWQPLLTGLPSVWVVFCLIEWFASKRKLGAYLIANVLITSIYFAVIMYYKYFGVIVTFHAFQQIGQVAEVRGSVFSLLHPYFLLIYTDFIAFLILMAFNKRFRRWSKRLAVREPRRAVVGLLIVSLAACIANVWQNRSSINELKQAESMGILNYEAYAVYTSATERKAEVKAVAPAAIAETKGVREPASPQYWAQAKGKNVIVIQLEAMQNILLGAKIDGKELTPNLNRLAEEALYFPRFYQMVGQGNTADAEYVVNTSLLVPQHGAASQDFGDVRLPGMPRVLSEQGYDTVTFHTNDAKFWNRKALYPALGFGRYYDKSFFGDEDVVFFGSSDEVLYAKTAAKLREMSASGKPFYAQLISMSGHHPFTIPEDKIRISLPERYRGTLVGDYIQAQNYADYALGRFIADLKSSGLWDNSVVVIYGDHMGLPIYTLSAHERELMKEILHREYRFPEMLNIPLIISVPGIRQPQVLPQVGGQADIFPTVANLLGVSLAKQVHFGQDLLNNKSNLLPERYYLPSGSFVNDNGIFVPGEGYADGTFYPFDGGEGTPAQATEEQFKRALHLLELSDGYVQSLPRLD